MSKLFLNKYSPDKKDFSILVSFIVCLFIGFLIFFFGISNIFAATFDTFYVTWYYRNKSNENNLLNVGKGQDTPLYASTSEYVNGYTTRIENTFTKDIQYIINYELQMWFSPEQELNYRSDTLQRIIDYSYTDSDFKILNVTANENWNRSSSIGDTVLTIKVSMQILALNNTDAIRFGVYTDNNISIGFYNHTDQIDYYLVNNISIEENANATIIDQNNQIIQGQDGINNNITNSTNTITGSITETEDNLNSSIQSSQDNINQNIDDMEDAIVNSNKETQDVIKDQFNDCHYSNNILNFSDLTSTYNGVNVIRKDGIITLSGIANNPGDIDLGTYTLEAGNYYQNINGSDGHNAVSVIRSVENNKLILVGNGVFVLTETTTVRFGIYFNEKFNGTYIYKPMVNKGTTSLTWEPGGQEICSNKIDETNDKLDNLQGALTDSSLPDTSGYGDVAGWLPAGTIDSLINLPLTLLTSINNNAKKSCTPYNLPFINNTTIQIPCIGDYLSNLSGWGSLINIIDLCVSGFFLYKLLMSLYKQIQKLFDLNNSDANLGGIE